jgi:hypothetical protein
LVLIPSRADQMSRTKVPTAFRPASPTISRALDKVTRWSAHAEYASELKARARARVVEATSDLEELIAKRARKAKPAIPTLSDAAKVWADALESEEGTGNLTDMEDSTSRARGAAVDLVYIASRKSLEESAKASALSSAACTFVEQLRRIHLEHDPMLLPRQGPVTPPAAVAAVDERGCSICHRCRSKNPSLLQWWHNHEHNRDHKLHNTEAADGVAGDLAFAHNWQQQHRR